MRAWILKGQTQLLAALFTSGCWLVPQVADCQESVVSIVRTASIPVSNIPLPIAVSTPEQKPTSAIFSDKEILVTEWQISPKILYIGTQKSVQSKYVSVDCISAPVNVERPPSESPIVRVSAISSRKAEPQAEVTYLAELNQLLQGGSNWLYANEGLLDLSPEEGSTTAISYLDDLNALVGIKAVASPNAQCLNTATMLQGQSENAQSSVPATPNTSAQPYTSIAPDLRCNGVEGFGVSALFQSMSRVRVNGLSTAPPVQPRQSATPNAQLERPVNDACQYMDPYSPAYYSTPPRFGAPRPDRNTHVLMHQPLYFEDANLERCGQTSGCMTTAVSAVHFATAITFSSYHMAVEHPASCVRSLPDCPTCHSFD